VEVSKKNASGLETIPARYNRESILGAEVFPRKLRALGAEEREGGKFELTSKVK
jgi:hypothetical protein